MLHKIIGFFFSRIFLIGALVLIQVSVLFVAVFALSQYFMWFYIAIISLSALMMVILFSRNENPSYKLIWAFVISVFPLIGAIFYVMWGVNKVDPKVKKDFLRIHDSKEKEYYGQSGECLDKLKQKSEKLQLQAKYIENSSCARIYENTSAEYYALGEDMFADMKEELRKAEKFIFLEFFIIGFGTMLDETLEILKQKIEEGVEVRIMYDDIGSINTLPYNYDVRLRELGIKAIAFNRLRPRLYAFMNYRDHRKICVVDNRVGFMGGLNIADEYINKTVRFGHWKDTAVKIEGDAVWSCTLMFLQQWDFASGESHDWMKYKISYEKQASDGFVQPYGDDPINDICTAENAYLNIINRAEEYVYITTPYLVVDNEIIVSLCNAAQSGVDVRIITPGIPDKKAVYWVTQSYYKILLEAGVRIYEYTPGFMHAKMFVSDDNVAVVGTANMDYRSLYLHFECCTAFYYSSIVSKTKEDIVKTIDRCREITLEDIVKVSRFKRIAQLFLRVFSPLL